MPKVIDLGVREIVLKVREHFLKEKEQLDPIPFGKVNDRLAAATGLSLRALSRIANETSMPDASVSKKDKKKKRKIRHNIIPNEKIKKKTMAKETLAVVYLDERNSGRMGPELTQEFWRKVKEKDLLSDPIIPEDQEFVNTHISDEPSSEEENPRMFKTDAHISDEPSSQEENPRMFTTDAQISDEPSSEEENPRMFTTDAHMSDEPSSEEEKPRMFTTEVIIEASKF